MKTCRKCGAEYYGRCKICLKAYHRKYRQDNAERIAATVKSYYSKNRDKILEYTKEYCRTEKSKKYRNDYEKRRRKTDPIFKLRRNCSSLIRIVMKSGKAGSSITNYLPYTMLQLKEHLEKLFDQNMNWENYGTYWHIDHIMPQSKLPYTSMSDENFQKCWALDNLQPLEAIENIKKSNKVPNVPK